MGLVGDKSERQDSDFNESTTYGVFLLRTIKRSIHTTSESRIEWGFRVRKKIKHNTRDNFFRENPFREKKGRRRKIHCNSPIYRNYRCIFVFL